MDALRYDVTEETATITLTNPDLRNALTAETAEELHTAVDSIEETDARCLVVQGSDGTFSAGGDIQAMLEGVSEDWDPQRRIDAVARPLHRAIETLYTCPLPTIAKVDGPAFGAGGALVLACDLALASERAKISFGFRQVGLAVDSGTSYLLPRVVGASTAKELVFTGELIDAERAADLGLFNRVYPTDSFEQDARSVIDRVATGPTVALSESKALLNADSDSLSEAMDREMETLETTLATADHAEGAQAFVEQRDPDFSGN